MQRTVNYEHVLARGTPIECIREKSLTVDLNHRIVWREFRLSPRFVSYHFNFMTLLAPLLILIHVWIIIHNFSVYQFHSERLTSYKHYSIVTLSSHFPGVRRFGSTL